MIDQSAPLTKPKSSHSLISTEPPDNGFTDYPNSTDLSFELRIATLANFSIQQKFNNIGKAMKPGATSKIERISTFLKAPVALVIRNPADRAWLATQVIWIRKHCLKYPVPNTLYSTP